MHASGLMESEKPTVKILTSRGRFDVARPAGVRASTYKTGSVQSTDQLFEGNNSYLWSMVYVLAYSDSIVAFIEDEDVIDAFSNACMDSITDLLYQPLHKKSWSLGKPNIDLKGIERVLEQVKGSSIRYKNSPIALIFLNLLLDGIQKFAYPPSMKEETGIGYTGIYQLFKFVGGLSNNCDAHLAEINLKYQNQSFLVRGSSNKKFVFSVYSLIELCDKSIKNLDKLHRDFTEGYEDVIIYDLKTGMKVEDITLLYKCRDKKLAFSTLITNNWRRDPFATFKFESEPTAFLTEKLWFMVTCELGNFGESIWYGVKAQMQNLVKCKDWSKVYFKVEINGEIGRASGIGLLDLLKKAFKWRDHMFDKLIVVKFGIESRCTIVGFETIHIREEISPDKVLDQYYKQNSRVHSYSDYSSQLLLVEYCDDIGIDNSMLCKDIHSKWLDERKWYCYQLRGVIIQDKAADGKTITMPIVKLSDNCWYNPYYNYNMSELDPSDDIRTYIYEKSVKYS